MITNSRRIFLVAFAFVLSLGMNAADRDSIEMLSIANTFFKGTAYKSKSNASSQNVIKKRYSTDKLNVYENVGKRFVVVAKDDSYPEVIGYSDNSAFPDTLPDGLKWWLAKADSSMKLSTSSALSASDILSSLTSTSSVATSVTPFVTTQWGQEGAYNLLTPTINNVHTPTGCVATSMAQCLKYLGYPSTSKGTGSYTVSVVDSRNDTTTTNYSYNFGQYTYNWSGMADNYTASSYSTSNSSALAVSQLMMDCGAAANMQYMSDGSGTNLFYATHGLYDNLQCDSNSIRVYDRLFYSDSEWTNMVYEELNAGYPIIYSGIDATSQAGHAFVFDGYNADGYVHVNWGWEGVADGYYDMSILKPTVTSYKFSTDQMMTTGIRSKSDLRDYQSQWLLYDDLKISKSIRNSTYSCTIGVAVNYGPMCFKGNIYLLAKSSSGSYTELFTLTDPYYIGTLYGFENYPLQGISISSLSNGTYTLMLATKGYSGKGTLESTYQPMLIYPGVIGTYTLVKTSSGTTLTANKATTLATGIDEVENTATEADDGITRVYNTQGQLLYSGATSSFSESDIPVTKGVVIIKQGSSVKKKALNN